MSRILLIEDERLIAESLIRTLHGLGYEVRHAADGTAGLKLALSETPDLVILDIMLPGGIDGLQLCQAIKLDPLTAATKVFLLTAKGQVADIEAGERAGADQYIVKPFSPLALLEAVQNCCRH